MRTCEHTLSKLLLLHKSTSGFVCSAGLYSTKEVSLSFKHTVAPPVVRKRTVSKLADNWCCSWVCVLINSNTHGTLHATHLFADVSSDKMHYSKH